MRRGEREVKSLEEIAEILSRCDTIRLGVCDADAPYIVPVSFGFELTGGKISVYFHGAKEGRRARLLLSCPRVCVEADLCHGFPSNGTGGYTCDYESVIGWGFAELLEGSEAERGIRLLMEHCGILEDGCPENAMAITRVNRIVLDEITGKQRKLSLPHAED
jgi:uncharacterized protein